MRLNLHAAESTKRMNIETQNYVATKLCDELMAANNNCYNWVQSSFPEAIETYNAWQFF